MATESASPAIIVLDVATVRASGKSEPPAAGAATGAGVAGAAPATGAGVGVLTGAAPATGAGVAGAATGAGVGARVEEQLRLQFKPRTSAA